MLLLSSATSMRDTGCSFVRHVYRWRSATALIIGLDYWSIGVKASQRALSASVPECNLVRFANFGGLLRLALRSSLVLRLHRRLRLRLRLSLSRTLLLVLLLLVAGRFARIRRLA